MYQSTTSILIVLFMCVVYAWHQPSVNESDLGYPWDRIGFSMVWTGIRVPPPPQSCARTPWIEFKIVNFQFLSERRALQKLQTVNFQSFPACSASQTIQTVIVLNLYPPAGPYRYGKRLFFETFAARRDLQKGQTVFVLVYRCPQGPTKTATRDFRPL